MKTLLQLNLDSALNKNYYRIKKNCLILTKDEPHSQYSFDNICYSGQDVNSSIIYDIIVDYSQKNKIMASTSSCASINIDQPSYKIDHNRQTLAQSERNQRPINQNYKQPQFSYVILLDQIVDTQAVQLFIKELSTTQVFRKQSIKIGHFLIHQNGIYDFHQPKSDLTQTQREQLERQNEKRHGSIQDNFMWIYNKQINLCQQIKLNNIPHLAKTISYIQCQQFNHLHQPSLGLQLATNLTKAEDIKHKQLQNKKILEVYIINIGVKIRIVLVLFNYNKNYSLSADQGKQFNQLLTMHGALVGEIKYQTVKIQILNKLMKNCEKLFYVMYFPGPKLHQFSIDAPIYQTNKNCALQKTSQSNLFGVNSNTGSQLFTAKNSVYKKQGMHPQLQSSKISTYSRSNSPDKFKERICCIFQNYNALISKDRDNLQKIIKDYLVKKQDNLKNELEKVKQRVKQLKLTHRIQQCQVAELKSKCTKALQKMSSSIVDLQRMGITNVQRHMDWLKLVIDEKKTHIRQEEQEIQNINKRIIEGRKSHQYFYKKMLEFRDRLKQKQLQLIKKDIKQSEKLNRLESQSAKQNGHQHQRSNLTQLSAIQLEQLEQHKEKLKSKLVQKLKNSSEKKIFFDTLSEIKKKVTKLQIAKLEQKYFDLLHD